MPKKYSEMNKHEKHSYLVDKVRREYQAENPGSRMFKNTSGVAWQGHAQSGAGKVELLYPRPIKFGIPEPKPNEENGSGGADLLGVTIIRIHYPPTCKGEIHDYEYYPIFTAIEIKTGKSRLKKNQKIFRKWVLSINGIYFLGRECPICHGEGEYFITDESNVALKIQCGKCEGKQYILIRDGE